MKKLILISLCAVFCVLLCACGEKKEESSETSTTAESTSATAASTAAASASDPENNKTTGSNESSTDSSNVTPYESAKEAAVAEAKGFLAKANYSYDGLYKELVYMGYADEDARYGVDNCGADWTEQAVKRAKALVSQTRYSYDNLLEKLESEGFTNAQAAAGAIAATQSKSSGSDDSKTLSAIEAATKYYDTGNYSYSGLIDKLIQDGYSATDAENAANNCGADWNKLAAEEAKEMIQRNAYTKEELIDRLVFSGYTFAQAAYAAEANGL